MTGKIFLSYRREDTTGFAWALFGRLEQSFPSERLFMDVEGGIRAGQDFVRVLEEEVRACDVMLVLIGPDWLTVADEQGRRRLENPQDFVRIEVESALRLGKRVIPVLVQKTEMPRADALPEPLKELAWRHAIGVTRFKADAQGLIKVLEDALAEVEEARRQAETEATAAENRRVADEAAKAEEAVRSEKERARLEAIAGLSPDQIAKAEELVNWDFIKDGKSNDEFRDHLARFPQGVTKGLARARLEALVWDALPRPINTAALKGFLEEFPKGARAGEAMAKLAELESQAAAMQGAVDREKREMDAWASASAAGTAAAFEDFQKDWPQSKYADAARKRIREIKGVPSRRRLLRVGVGVGVAALGGGALLEFLPGFLFWRLLYDQSTRTFAGHTDWVNSVAFSPDGSGALSGSDDRTLKLWDVATGKEICNFAGHTDRVVSVAFSPSGRSALSGSWDGTLKLWDVATGKEIRSFAGHANGVDSVAFSPDGRTALSGGNDTTLKLWNVATGKVIRSFAGHTNSVWSVAFSPDGRTALSGGWDGTLKLWDVATGKEIRTFVGHALHFTSVAFAPDGRSALSGSLDGTKLCDVATGKEIRSLNDDIVNSVALGPDGSGALSGGWNGTLKLCDVATGEEIRTFVGHAEEINSVAFSPDGRTALSGSKDKTLKLWDATGH